jgi:hypothetical protein
VAAFIIDYNISEMYRMSDILNPKLYEKAKKIADATYSKPSAYKSGFIVKKYKELGGMYGDQKPADGLTSWFLEKWQDVGGLDYPVYRPTKRVNKYTPLLPDEIDPENLAAQIQLKQVLKGKKNLPPFVGKGRTQEISDYSDIGRVERNATRYFGKRVPLYLSQRKNKKFCIQKPDGNWVHFGAMGYEDFTKHQDPVRQRNYLKRSGNIKGDWRDDPYSPNNLARAILWQ